MTSSLSRRGGNVGPNPNYEVPIAKGQEWFKAEGSATKTGFRFSAGGSIFGIAFSSETAYATDTNLYFIVTLNCTKRTLYGITAKPAGMPLTGVCAQYWLLVGRPWVIALTSRAGFRGHV